MASVLIMASQRWTSVIITVLLSVTFAQAMSEGLLDSYLRDIFSAEAGKDFNHLLISDASGTEYVYIGADNTVFQLDIDLTHIRNDSTDADPYCPSTPVTSPCPYTNNENKILVYAPPPVDRLILCRNLDGHCEFRRITDISRDGGYIGVATSKHVASPLSTIGIADIDGYLWVAASAGSSAIHDPLPAIAKRDTDQSNVPAVFSSENKLPVISSKITYLQGFIHSEFIYYLVRDERIASSVISKLGRICYNTTTHKDLAPYAEITLTCGTFTNIQAAHVLEDTVMYAIFMDDTDSALCSYTMADIEDKFVDGTCGCSSNSECRDLGQEIPYLSGGDCTDTYPVTRDDVRGIQCDGMVFGNLVYQYVEAVFALPGTIITDELQGGHTALVTMTQENKTVAFTSSSSGILNKVHINTPDGIGRVYETVDLQTSGEVLTDIHLDQGKEELYILTSRELMKLDIINCSQHATCDECIQSNTTDGGDPFCGWCTLEAMCTRQAECPNADETSKWLEYNEECIAINNIQPSELYIDSPSQDIKFNVTQLPSSSGENTYTCTFDARDSQRTMLDGNTFTCSTPAENERPEIPPQEDYTIMKLGVKSEETDNIIVEEDFFFFDCSHITNCSSCVNSMWGCEWCIYGYTCTHDPISDCQNDDIIHDQEMELCPRMEEISAEILVPVNLDTPITLNGTNLPTDAGKVTYRCLLDIQGDTTAVGVTSYSSDEVECEPFQYMYDSSDRLLELPVRISVEYGDGFIIDDSQQNTVTLYDCAAIGSSCSSCISTDIAAYLSCVWCENSECGVQDQTCEEYFPRGNTDKCGAPEITEIFPTSGPIEGGTTLTIFGNNLGASFDDILNVTVASIPCDHTNFNSSYVAGYSIDCQTSSSSSVTPGQIVINFVNYTADSGSGILFSYKDPMLTGFDPSSGLESGGTVLRIMGTDLDTGRVTEAMVGEGVCDIDSARHNSTVIECTTPKASRGENSTAVVRVFFDSAERISAGFFTYIRNPTVSSYEPNQVILSGGIPYKVIGRDFNGVQTVQMQITYEGTDYYGDCDISSDIEVICTSPALTTSNNTRRRRATDEASVAFVFDGYIYVPADNKQIIIVPQPTYDEFTKPMDVKSPGSAITLMGTDLNAVGGAIGFVDVCIGTGSCVVITVTNTTLECLTPDPEPAAGGCNGEPLTGTICSNDGLPCIVVKHGENLEFILGHAQYPVVDITLYIILGCVGGFIVICIVTFLVVVLIGRRNYYRRIEQTEKEIKHLIEMSKVEVMEGFFLGQEMHDIEEQLSGLGMPFVSHQDYMKSMLFFGLKVKPLTEDPENPSEMEERAMMEFSKLINKKEFLMVFIRTLDQCKNLTTQDKANIASLLTVVLVMEGKFRYFTDVLMSLMRETISEAADRRRHKQLFKRTETVEDKLLTNWISLAMFKFVKDSVGSPLYILYQAIKLHCEKGPVDAITGNSFFSLNFENLLTEALSFQEITLNVSTELGDEPVRVLDVDTITQVKEKILDAMYRKKHTKYQRSAQEVDLVIMAGNAGQLVLADKDHTTQACLGWCQLNSLQHYGINDGTSVTLTNKQDVPNSMPIPLNEEAENLFSECKLEPDALFPEFQSHLYKDDQLRQSRRISGHHEYQHAESTLEEGIKLFHLTQKLEEEPEEDLDEGCCDKTQRVLCFKGGRGHRKVREIYLQRLVTVKQSISDFVMKALEAMFTITEDGYVNNLNNIPFALRFLFNYFDEEASRYEDEAEVAATWKNNVLPLRFWSTILTHPSFIFNMRQSRIADASVIVLNQMLDNACKGVIPKLKMHGNECEGQAIYGNMHVVIKNASPSRLLFNQDLKDYIAMINTYYYNIKQTPKLEEAELQQECQRIGDEFTGLFSRLATLKQLYDYVRPHETKLVDALVDDENCKAAHFASSFERVGSTLDQPED